MPHREGRTPPSLFLEILDWMMLPLLLAWPVSLLVTYFAAQGVAHRPYDRELQQLAMSVARQVHFEGSEVRLAAADAGWPARVPGGSEAVYYQVRDGSDSVVAGEQELERPELAPHMLPGVAYFRDGHVRTDDVRIALVMVRDEHSGALALVQVAETTERRDGLANEIVTSVAMPQFAVIPAAVVLVWFGLMHGLRPLRTLAEKLAGRRPTDLSPIAESEVPEEIVPLIASVNHLLERLNDNLKAQQRFVANAAHQLRTPIAGLRTQTQLALRQQDCGDMRATLETILAGSERAGRLITQLLALARAETRQEGAPVAEPVDVNGLVRDCVGEWVPNAMSRQIDLGFDSAGWPAVIEGDAILLAELFNNLLDNAIRYTPEGGRITARVMASQNVVVQVEDNGVGIPAAERGLVFERFYRVLGTGVEGSGLGLAIVRGIAERHRGTVTIGDAPGGRGTVFTVSLPRRQAGA